LALLKNKRASGREQDLADLKILKRVFPSDSRSPK
jgi:hypothetical protein